MAENGAETPGGRTTKTPVAPKMNVATQFIRDVALKTFWRKNSGGELTPEVEVKVQVEPKKRSAENQYEVSLKINVTAPTKTAAKRCLS